MKWKLLTLAALSTAVLATSEASAQYPPQYNKPVNLPSGARVLPNGVTVLPNGVHILPIMRPGQRPIARVPVSPLYQLPLYQPQIGRRVRTKDLERYIERCIKVQFGAVIDDCDVDVDRDDLEVEIDIELDDRRFRRVVHNYVYSIPELRGWRIDLDIDD